MNELITLIKSLNEEETAAFLAFAKARNQRTDVKNLELFILLKKGVSKELDIKIYGKPFKNALHALTNRLKDSLIDFIATRGFTSESQEEMQLFKLLLSARILFEKEQYSLGFKTLKKANQKAQSMELYAILQEVYHTHVQYVHLDPKNNLEDIITAYRENEKRYLKESRMVMAYATMQKVLKSHPSDIYAVIKYQMNQFDISIDQDLSFKSLFQIMNIATEAATLKSDYASVSIFMNHIYQIVEQKKHLASKHLFYHLKILYLMSGTCFRNLDFARSQELLHMLLLKMQQQKGIYKNLFKEQYVLLESLNLNYTGNPQKALSKLIEIKKPSLSTQLAAVMFYFQQEDFATARKKINDFYHSDQFYEKKEGLIWVIQKNILEILIYIELNQPNLVESKMKSFIKRFKKRLEDLNEDRVLTFLKLLSSYYNNPHETEELSFTNKVEEAFHWKTAAREDIFVMSIYAYLKSKMENTSIYNTTLKLVNNTDG